MSQEHGRVIEVRDIRRIKYSDGTEFYILDLHPEKGWTNSFRDSLGSHIWHPCSVDENLLKSHFQPIATKLGVPLSYNTLEMVRAATKGGPGLLRSYFEQVAGHKIRVEEHQTAEGVIIRVKEVPEF